MSHFFYKTIQRAHNGRAMLVRPFFPKKPPLHRHPTIQRPSIGPNVMPPARISNVNILNTTRHLASIPIGTSPVSTDFSWMLPFIALGMTISLVALLDNLIVQPRETDVLHPAIDLTASKQKKYFVDSADYRRVGKKPKGDLSGEIVMDKEGRRYIKKGAPNLHSLLQEFLISNYLATVEPGHQPNSLIMQELRSDGSAQFYTLSRVFDNTMDLEDFLKLTDWKERLAKKNLYNFEVVLAADNVFSKQQDMKLANYIITEKEDGYYVASIDHECAGDSAISFSNKMIYTTNIHRLASRVRDLHPKDELNHSGLAGDPRVPEFINEAKKHMNEENILSFYQKIGQTNIEKFTKFVDAISGANGLISAEEAAPYYESIKKIHTGAIKFLYEFTTNKALENMPTVAPNEDNNSSLGCTLN